LEMNGSVRPTWASYKDASVYCGLGRTTLWQLRGENLIKSAKVGSRVLINLPSLDEYLQKKAEDGNSPPLDADVFDKTTQR
jgi:excisionase family DNA binding protein